MKINYEKIQQVYFFSATVTAFLSLLSIFSAANSSEMVILGVIDSILHCSPVLEVLVQLGAFFCGLTGTFMLIALLYAKYYYKQKLTIRYHLLLFPLLYSVMLLWHANIIFKHAHFE